MVRSWVVLVGAVGVIFGVPLGVVRAADLPLKAPVYKVPMAYNWTGFYVGGHLGGGWSTVSPVAIDPTAAFPVGTAFNSGHLSGALGGIQAGYNYQMDRWVFGIEGEYSWARLRGSETTPGTGFTETTNYRSPYAAILAGRVGYAADRALWYVKGGGGWTKFSYPGLTVVNGSGALSDTFGGSVTESGWVIGGGVEWSFAPHWSVKLEYDHFDFGHFNNIVSDSLLGNLRRRVSAYYDEVKVGVNYLFNSAMAARRR